MTRIRRMLVANRGEIARRIFRTCRDMGIGTVAVCAEPDAEAPFVREADLAVALDGVTSAQTYLDIAKLVDAASRSGADAVHPGYGFLSENAAFARAVVEAGLTWVGPHAEAIAVMGDKLAAKKRLAQAGVPMLPSADCTGLSGDDLVAKANSIGYPVLVKASGGGGGRGMRVVKDEASLANAIAGARREAKSAFGNDAVFLEHYLEAARHVEVQVFGDKHGHVAHCFERECSIQRRHQKIIEEAPSPAVDADLRRRMGEAAVAAAFAIGYDNAGTVEFLLDSDGSFYFLEMNTRLQVEHPVTEAITGLDLVREQIRVAEGHELSFQQEDLEISGHAIEARLYAEDPAKNFFPVSGTVVRFEPDGITPIRIDSGVETGSDVSIYFDPMLAKVIAHAPTREEAALRLAGALERLRVPGLTTNRDFLVNTLHHPGFLSGDTTTAFIERHHPAATRHVSEDEVSLAALAAALHRAAERRAAQPVLQTLPAGWRNNRSTLQKLAFEYGNEKVEVGYAHERDGSLVASVNGREHRARHLVVDGETVRLELDGVLRRGTVTRSGDRVWVQTALGEVALRELPRFPEASVQSLAGGYTAPMPAKVISVHAAAGQKVTAGDLLLILEAMKMEHRITAAADGVVKELLAAEGAQVEAGQALLVMEGESHG